MKSLIVAALCFSSATALAADRNKPALSEFDGIDANRDGMISSAEHAVGAARMFEIMDADGDGTVSADEIEAAYEEVTGRKVSMGTALSAAEHAAASRAMFARMDADRDGFLSKGEWSAGHAELMKQAQK